MLIASASAVAFAFIIRAWVSAVWIVMFACVSASLSFVVASVRIRGLSLNAIWMFCLADSFSRMTFSYNDGRWMLLTYKKKWYSIKKNYGLRISSNNVQCLVQNQVFKLTQPWLFKKEDSKMIWRERSKFLFSKTNFI